MTERQDNLELPSIRKVDLVVERGKKPTTMSDVARLAGVSTAVVSYVINSGPRAVSEAAHARVLDAIDKLDYRPSASARALKLGSTGLLGVVVAGIANPYFGEMVDIVDVVASRRDTNVLLAGTRDDRARESVVVNMLVDRGVDGLIFLTRLHDESLYRLAASTVPRVLLGQQHAIPGLSTLGPDTFSGAVLATRHLIEHGHEHIGLIVGASGHDLRRAGWERALTTAGLPISDPVITTWDRTGGVVAARELMTRQQQPTAILAGSDLIAVGILQGLSELGIRVPHDVAVVSYDGTSESEFSSPPLTAIAQPFETMAEIAVDIVLDQQRHATHQLVPMSMIVRQSCGCGPPHE